jgi:hypothetical protein
MIPFYVGKGTDKRAYKHLTESLEKTNNPEKVKEIQKILESGKTPIIKIMYAETESEAFELEEFLTYHWGLRHKGGILTNMQYGGENGKFVGFADLPRTQKHKKKISKATKKYNNSHPEKWEKFTNQQKKEPKSPKACKKMSETKLKLYAEHPELHPRLGKQQSEYSIQVSREVNSGTWEITFPDHHKELITNLKLFCKEHSINHGNLANGSAAGYKAINLNPNKKKAKTQSAKDAISNARSCSYQIIFPDNHIEIISNLSKWRENNNIKRDNLMTPKGNSQGYHATKIES